MEDKMRKGRRRWIIAGTVGLILSLVLFVTADASSHDVLVSREAPNSGFTSVFGATGVDYEFVTPVNEVWTLNHVEVHIGRVDSSASTAQIEVRTEPARGGSNLCGFSQSMSLLGTTRTWRGNAAACGVELSPGTSYYIHVRCGTCGTFTALTWSHDGVAANKLFKIRGTSTPLGPGPTPLPYLELAACVGTGDEFVPITDHSIHAATPFVVTATASVDTVALRMRRTGAPQPFQVFIAGWGTNVLDGDAVNAVVWPAVSSSSASAAEVPTGSFGFVEMSMSPKAVLTPGTYSIVVRGTIGNISNRYDWHYQDESDCAPGEDDGAVNSQFVDNEPVEWWVTGEAPAAHSFRVRGQTFAVGGGSPAQAPPQGEPPGDVSETPVSYEYSWNRVNLYKGTDLVYDLTDMTAPVRLQVRRISEVPGQHEGEAVAVLEVFDLEPDGGNEAELRWITTGVQTGAVDVYDATNGVRLMRHYVAEPPAWSFLGDRAHRCGSSCSIAHGALVYREVGAGRLHPVDVPGGYDLVAHDYGRPVFLHVNLGDVSGEYISIRHVNTGLQSLILSVDEVRHYLGADEGFLILPTDGNNIPYVQNLDVPAWLTVVLEPGVYNYAFVDDMDQVLGEGESVLVVKVAAAATGYQLTTGAQNVGLGGTWASTYRQNHAEVREVYAAYGVETLSTVDVVPVTNAASQTVRVHLPETWHESLPASLSLGIAARPSLLPYSETPEAYGFLTRVSVTVQETLGPVETIREGARRVFGDGNGLALMSLLVVVGVVAFGAWREWNPGLVTIMAGLVFVALVAVEFIDRDAVIVAAIVFGGLLVLWLYLRHQGGE